MSAEQKAIPPSERLGKPFKRLPRFLKALGTYVEEGTPLSRAASRYLSEAGVEVNIAGTTAPWSSKKAGVILYGDHKHGVEPILLLSAHEKLNEQRQDVWQQHTFGKPWSFGARLARTFNADIVLPVIPKGIAKDKTARKVLSNFNRHLLLRIIYRRKLPTQAEITENNNNSMARAGELLGEGQSVVIFPQGGVRRSTEHKWYSGIGKLVKQVPEEKQKDVYLAGFQFEKFNSLRLLSRLFNYHLGIRGRMQSIVHFAVPISIAEFRQSQFNGQALENIDEGEITKALHKVYIRSFGA